MRVYPDTPIKAFYDFTCSQDVSAIYITDLEHDHSVDSHICVSRYRKETNSPTITMLSGYPYTIDNTCPSA